MISVFQSWVERNESRLWEAGFGLQIFGPSTGSPKNSMALQFESEFFGGNISIWETGECDIVVLNMETGECRVNTTTLFDNTAQLEAALDCMVQDVIKAAEIKLYGNARTIDGSDTELVL